MDYERRFKRLTAELLSVIERHIREWDDAERGVFDIDEVMDNVEASEETEPVDYSRQTKNAAEKRQSRKR